MKEVLRVPPPHHAHPTATQIHTNKITRACIMWHKQALLFVTVVESTMLEKQRNQEGTHVSQRNNTLPTTQHGTRTQVWCVGCGEGSVCRGRVCCRRDRWQSGGAVPARALLSPPSRAALFFMEGCALLPARHYVAVFAVDAARRRFSRAPRAAIIVVERLLICCQTNRHSSRRCSRRQCAQRVSARARLLCHIRRYAFIFRHARARACAFAVTRHALCAR